VPFKPLPAKVEKLAEAVVDAALTVHEALGPGLLESVYEAALAEELRSRGIQVRTQVPIPVKYRNAKLDIGFRIDLLVGGQIVVEAKSVEALHPVHEAQLLTHMKLSGRRLGFLINFNVHRIKDGIRRMIL